jgi:hypothetical protein
MEAAVCGTLPGRIRKNNLVFLIVHGFMARLVSLHHVFDADWFLFVVCFEDCQSLVVTAMASSSEASAASLPSSIVLLRCNHGSDLDTPFMDKLVMKRKVQMKLSQLPPDIGRHMTLKKLHIKENGWALLLFFEHIQEALHAEVSELLKSWVGSQGSVRFLSDAETATQTMQDIAFRGEKRTSSNSLGDLDKTTSLLSLCLELQGSPAGGSGLVKKDVSKEQRRNASLALRCFNRAQAQTAKNLNGSGTKLAVEDTVSDEESNV